MLNIPFRQRFLKAISFAIVLVCLNPLIAQQKPSFTVGWSVYVGWDPYYYMGKSGILRKWADKYGINITVQRFDYAPSLDAFVAKNIDACAMTNMEALDMPAAAGIDTTAIIDRRLLERQRRGADAAGRHAAADSRQTSAAGGEDRLPISVRARDGDQWAAAIRSARCKYVNTSDSDIASAFLTDSSKPVVVTWKPMVSQIMKTKGMTTVFNSSQIPGRNSGSAGGADGRVESSRRLRPEVRQGDGRRLVRNDGQMSAPGAAGDKVLTEIGEASQDTLASYKEQLTTTHMFYTPLRRFR